MEWRRKGERLIPVIPKSREFKRELRKKLLDRWSYAAHYVDSISRETVLKTLKNELKPLLETVVHRE